MKQHSPSATGSSRQPTLRVASADDAQAEHARGKIASADEVLRIARVDRDERREYELPRRVIDLLGDDKESHGADFHGGLGVCSQVGRPRRVRGVTEVGAHEHEVVAIAHVQQRGHAGRTALSPGGVQQEHGEAVDPCHDAALAQVRDARVDDRSDSAVDRCELRRLAETPHDSRERARRHVLLMRCERVELALHHRLLRHPARVRETSRWGMPRRTVEKPPRGCRFRATLFDVGVQGALALILSLEAVMTTRYMFLIFGDEAAMSGATQEQWDEMLQAHNAWGESVHAAGASIVSGEALQPTATATTVRKGAGAPVVTDGPFAETKEALGGYYVLDCTDLDQALALAHSLPAATVEVRPIIPT